MKKIILLVIFLSAGVAVQSQSWNLTGNGGTNPAVNFIGTTDNSPLKFRVKNYYSGEVDSATGKTFFGYGAGISTTTGVHNTAVGIKALSANLTGVYNTAIGKSALNFNRANYNTACGADALLYNIFGTQNSALGVSALALNYDGGNNTAVGNTALYSNVSGYSNTATGVEALYYNTTGYYNTATGVDALVSNNTGWYNTANGVNALRSNTSGGQNTATGFEALYYNSTGNNNTAIGSHSLYGTTAAFNNTAVGAYAGDSYNMGWNNTLVGSNSDVNATDRFNCVALGQSAYCSGNNQARIGNSSTTSIGGFANWTNISDGRVKKNVMENVPGLSFITKLKPVTYNLDLDVVDKIIGMPEKKDKDGKIIPAMPFEMEARRQKEQIVYSGFIAQDVEKTAKELGFDFSGVDAAKNDKDLYGLRYAEFVVPLVKAVQEQQQIIADLQERIIALEKKGVNNGSSAHKAANPLKVSPNPVQDMVSLSIISAGASQAMIKIIDSKGALVKQQQAGILKGENRVGISMKGLTGGAYYISVEWNDGQIKETAQVIKQ